VYARLGKVSKATNKCAFLSIQYRYLYMLGYAKDSLGPAIHLNISPDHAKTLCPMIANLASNRQVAIMIDYVDATEK
jgi:hypothetical protein